MIDFSTLKPAALVRRFSRNLVGRDLLVGDIHGHFTKLQAALDAVGFAPGDGDRLFSVGDLVDRGPESHLALSWLDQPWFFAVAGNHEDFAIRWPNGHMDAAHYCQNGGAWNVANLPQEQALFAEAFRALPIAVELETAGGLVGIVHAGCPRPSWPDFVAALESPCTRKMERDHLVSMAQWSRHRIEHRDDCLVSGVRAVVVGHTPVDRVTCFGNVLFIDTGAWLPPERGSRPFAILDAATLRPATQPIPGGW